MPRMGSESPPDTAPFHVKYDHDLWPTNPVSGDDSATDESAVAGFLDNYVLYPCNESSMPGFLEHLPCLFKEVNVDGRHALRWAVQAAGFADISRTGSTGRSDASSRALECYGRALTALGKTLADKERTPDDYTLMTVVILDIFEVLYCSLILMLVRSPGKLTDITADSVHA